MKRIKRFLLGRKYHRLSVNFVVISFSVTLIMVLCLHGSYDQVEPKSYTYFGGWQESNICNNSEKIPVSFFTTIRDKNFEMNLFIHDPTKDTVSKQLFVASVLTRNGRGPRLTASTPVEVLPVKASRSHRHNKVRAFGTQRGT